jgi:hypothetical protein
VNALQDGAPHWQVAHAEGPKLRNVFERLERERVQLGVLHWSGESGQALIGEARAFVATTGWVTSDRVARLIGAVQFEAVKRQGVSEPSHDFLDQLLAEQSERYDADRLAGAIAELSLRDEDASR